MFTVRDLDLLKCIQQADDGDLKPGRANESGSVTSIVVDQHRGRVTVASIVGR
jgi:hypothetical protein